MLAHGHRLMRPDAQIGQWPSGAQENKAGILILRKEPDGIPLVYFA
jgi:hypothetical protein